MSDKSFPLLPLGDILTPISRPESVDPEKIYRILGAHWYAEGLYIKDIKSGSQIQADKVYRVEQGDFVYNRLFAWKGSFAVATAKDNNCYVSNEFPSFTINRDKVNTQYLQRYFCRASAWDEALGLSSGGTPTSRNRLKEDKLLSMRIPLPPLEEQQRIVARIEGLAAKIEEARGLRREAVVETEVVLQAARRKFVGEVPFSDWLPLKTFIAEIENGWSPACENRPAIDDEWGVLKLGAVSFGSYNESENKALPPMLEPKVEYEVQVGDFLMSRANTTSLVGACVLVEQTRPKLMLSDKIFRFIFRDLPHINRHYLEHVFKSPALRSQIENGATGTSQTMKNISKEKVLNLLIPPHNSAEQQRIVSYLDALQSQLDILKRTQSETSAELDALLPSILDKAFKGEL
jgi:type I restriction enzyme S subunit